MKVKKIQIKSRSEFESDLSTLARRWDTKKLPIGTLKGDYFESLEAVRKVLTDKRLELWRRIRDHKPSSILELSKLVKRDFRGVHRDVNILKAVGLIHLVSEKGKRGDVQKPVSSADSLVLEVA
jgi:predicted transcriptional regulator